MAQTPRSPPPIALLAVANALLLAFAVQGIHVDDTDTFYHLANGRWMLEHGRVLDHEALSFTLAGQPWTNYHWAFQVLIAAAERAAGLPGVIAVRAGFVLLTGNLLLLLIWRLCGRQRLPATALALLGLALYLSRALNVRPHLGSHLCLVALIVLLERFRASSARFDPWIPAVFVLWANLHGVEYPIGLAVVVVYAAAGALEEASARRWLLLLATCVAALLVNPFGPRVLLMPAMAGDTEVMAVLDEMRSLAPSSLFELFPRADLTSQTWLNVALLAGLAAVPRWARRRDVRSLALYAVAAALALRSLRFRPEAGILLVCVLAAEFRRLDGTALRLARRAAAVLVVLLVVASVATVSDHLRRGFFRTLDLTRYPVAACRWMSEQQAAGRLLADPGIVGYVSWCAPSVRIFSDMRSPDPFPGPLVWLPLAAGQEVPLDRVDRTLAIDLVLMRNGSPGAQRLLADPQAAFAPVSVDTRFVLFAKAAAARERGLVVAFPRGIDAPAPPDALREQSERLLRTWSGNAFANETLARLDLEQGRPADAGRRAAAMAELYPRDATWPWIVGRARAAQNDLGGAASALRQARRWSPESARVALDLARVLLAAGRFGEGAEVLESEARRRAYRLSGEEFVVLGALREGAGRREAAADAYTRALWIGGPGVDADHLRSRLAALPRAALVPPADPGPR